MVKTYQWRNETILDIEKWAFDRNEKMVDIVWKIKNVNPYAGRNAISYYEEKDTMPESFFNTLRMPPNHVIKSCRSRDPKSANVGKYRRQGT